MPGPILGVGDTMDEEKKKKLSVLREHTFS